VILEAFKPGTAPPDSYSVIGADANGVPTAGSPDTGTVVRTGTGGLY
jgi:penicillin-binding protein 1A